MSSDENSDDKPDELPIIKKKDVLKQERNPRAERPRDPRFDERCSGSSDLRHFVRNYDFLDDIQKKELSELKKASKKEKDPDKKRLLQSSIGKLEHKLNSSKKVSVLPGTTLNLRPKKKEDKKQSIVDKFHELKKSGRLSKYLERKRKKLIKRDGRRAGLIE